MVLESGSASRGKFDLLPVGERLQYFHAVVADGRQFDSLLFKSCFGVLQLDQLPFAVRSPVGGTKEKQNGAVRSFQRGQALFLAKLVASRERRGLLTDAQPNIGEHLEGRDVKGIVRQRALDGDAVSQMTNGLVLWIEGEQCSVVSSNSDKLCARPVILGALGDSAKASSAVQLLLMMTPDHDPELCRIVLPHERVGRRKSSGTAHINQCFAISSPSATIA